MNRLLFSDTHFTDRPIDDYRWEIFEFLKKSARENNVNEINCLGDLVDTKDRFSADLVNFLVDRFVDLANETKCHINILAGNHDKPLQEPYYWEIINKLKGSINYITKPTQDWDGVLFLPFSSKAVVEWERMGLENAVAIFMHQTLEGAIVEDDRKIPSNPYPLPPLPNVPIFSGDVHRPQTLNNITYIGAPYPVRFSETWDNRIILIKEEDFKHPVSIKVPTIKRAILDISSSKDLSKYTFKADDQLKIRYKLEANSFTSFAEEEIVIRKWAQEKGIFIVSLEPSLSGEGIKSETAQKIDLMPPSDVLKAFATQEGLSEDVIQMGNEILNESK